MTFERREDHAAFVGLVKVVEDVAGHGVSLRPGGAVHIRVLPRARPRSFKPFSPDNPTAHGLS